MDKQLFLDLYEAFENAAPAFNVAGVKPVKFLDRYRGQPLNPEQFEYYDLPAIFIDRSVVWSREGQVYNGTLQLRFHCVTDPTWDTSNIATNKEAALEYFNWLDKVREVLDNFRACYCSSLFRTTDEAIDTGVVLYEVLGYQCEYYGSTKINPTYESAYPESVKITGRNLLTRR